MSSRAERKVFTMTTKQKSREKVIKFIKDNVEFYDDNKSFLLDGEFVGGGDVKKFCIHSNDRRLIVGTGSVNHAQLIDQYAKKSLFDDWVRGIYFKSSKIIYLRDIDVDPVKNFDILYDIKEVLERLGKPKSVKVELGGKYRTARTEKLLYRE